MIKTQISKFSNNVKKIKAQLGSKFDLFFEGHLNKVTCVAITSDNKDFISGSGDETIRIWNLLEKRQENDLEGHSDEVATLAKTSDDKYIVSSSKDKTVRIWNVLENRQKSVFYGHISRVLKVAVTSNNKFIVSGSDDKTVEYENFKHSLMLFRIFIITDLLEVDKTKILEFLWSLKYF